MSDGYRTQSFDTDRATEEYVLQRYRSMTPAEKLAIVDRLRRMVLVLARAGIRDQYPGLSPAEADSKLAERVFGTDRIVVRREE